MEGGMFGILVLSGLYHLTSPFLHRQYHFINTPQTWHEAQQYCREKHTDLFTITTEQDLEELAGLTESGVTHVFLGLYRSWGWSRSEADDYKEGESAYWNWASGHPVKQYCGSIGVTGQWIALDCSTVLNFFCYNGSATTISERFNLGEGAKNWIDARAYCRNLHTDLARVRNQLENEELQKSVNYGSVWIGLTRSSWVWSDKSEPSFTPWKPQELVFNGLDDCSGFEVNSKPVGIIQASCDGKMPFFCFFDPGPLRTYVRLSLTADSSTVDMTDPAVRESILKWVDKTLREKDVPGYLKLSWTKPPRRTKRKRFPCK